MVIPRVNHDKRLWSVTHYHNRILLYRYSLYVGKAEKHDTHWHVDYTSNKLPAMEEFTTWQDAIEAMKAVIGETARKKNPRQHSYG